MKIFPIRKDLLHKSRSLALLYYKNPKDPQKIDTHNLPISARFSFFIV